MSKTTKPRCEYSLPSSDNAWSGNGLGRKRETLRQYTLTILRNTPLLVFALSLFLLGLSARIGVFLRDMRALMTRRAKTSIVFLARYSLCLASSSDSASLLDGCHPIRSAQRIQECGSTRSDSTTFTWHPVAAPAGVGGSARGLVKAAPTAAIGTINTQANMFTYLFGPQFNLAIHKTR
jgi:hypothetical protein